MMQQVRTPIFAARLVSLEHFAIFASAEAANLWHAAGVALPAEQRFVARRSVKTGHFLGCFADFEQRWRAATYGTQQPVPSHRFAASKKFEPVFPRVLLDFGNRTCGMALRGSVCQGARRLRRDLRRGSAARSPAGEVEPDNRRPAAAGFAESAEQKVPVPLSAGGSRTDFKPEPGHESGANRLELRIAKHHRCSHGGAGCLTRYCILLYTALQ